MWQDVFVVVIVCCIHVGPSVVAAETVPVRMYTGHAHGNPDQTYTWNRGERSEHWLYVLRVYLDGPYSEPPPEVLPGRPEIVEDGCCTVL